MMSQLVKSSFTLVMKHDLMDQKTNKLICLVMSIMLAKHDWMGLDEHKEGVYDINCMSDVLVDKAT